MLRPAPGECVDRQTILMLKAKFGTLKKINTKPFTDELNDIQEYLEKNWYFKLNETEGATNDALIKQLQVVNGELWKIEDEIRLRMSNDQNRDVPREADIARIIPTLNDKRAKLVQDINAIFQCATVEKVYVAS